MNAAEQFTMGFRSASIVLLTTLLSSTPSGAVEPYRGKLLYDNFCYYCHYRNIHFRPRSKVRSLDDLAHQIGIWQEELRLDWSQRDIADVQAYLNWLYYGYPYSIMIPVPRR